MEVEKKLSMSLDDLIKKTKPVGANRKSKGALPVAGKRGGFKGKRDEAAVRNGRNPKPTKALVHKSKGGKFGIRKAVPIAKRNRRESMQVDDGPVRQRRLEKKPTRVVRKTEEKSSVEASGGKKFSRKVVIKKGPNAPGEQRKIKIQNVPYDLTWKDIKSALSDVGKIERCDVEHGEATVLFSSHNEAKKAVQTYNGGDMNGRKIKVTFL